MKRIGIFSGTFDPVHAGHIGFALQAIQEAKLDQVVFLPERLPRGKTAEHFGHRVAMLERALRPHARLAMLELADKRFSVQRTWPQLQRLWPGSQLVLLAGSDVIPMMQHWPGSDKMLQTSELVIGLRTGESPEAIQLRTQLWPIQPPKIHVLQSHAPEISSSSIRNAMRHKTLAAGLLTSVRRYATSNWLYVTLP